MHSFNKINDALEAELIYG